MIKEESTRSLRATTGEIIKLQSDDKTKVLLPQTTSLATMRPDGDILENVLLEKVGHVAYTDGTIIAEYPSLDETVSALLVEITEARGAFPKLGGRLDKIEDDLRNASSLDAVRELLKSDIFTELNTANKTIIGGINEVNGKIGSLSELSTADKSNLVAAINENNGVMGLLSNLNTNNKSNLVAAINENSGIIGPIADLSTDSKTDLVSAINELFILFGTIPQPPPASISIEKMTFKNVGLNTATVEYTVQTTESRDKINHLLYINDKLFVINPSVRELAAPHLSDIVFSQELTDLTIGHANVVRLEVEIEVDGVVYSDSHTLTITTPSIKIERFTIDDPLPTSVVISWDITPAFTESVTHKLRIDGVLNEITPSKISSTRYTYTIDGLTSNKNYMIEYSMSTTIGTQTIKDTYDFNFTTAETPITSVSITSFDTSRTTVSGCELYYTIDDGGNTDIKHFIITDTGGRTDVTNKLEEIGGKLVYRIEGLNMGGSYNYTLSVESASGNDSRNFSFTTEDLKIVNFEVLQNSSNKLVFRFNPDPITSRSPKGYAVRVTDIKGLPTGGYVIPDIDSVTDKYTCTITPYTHSNINGDPEMILQTVDHEGNFYREYKPFDPRILGPQ